MIYKILLLGVVMLSLGCAKDSSAKIVDIPEASGIDYCTNSNTLVVANDEGWYYEISLDGRILTKYKIKGDLEGVVCEDETFLFAVENKGLLKVNRKTKKKKFISIDMEYNGKNIKLISKNNGIEGITKVGELYYLSKQSKKKKDSLIAIVKIHNNKAKIVDIIKPEVADVAGLTYYKETFYMVSDKKDKVIKYNLDKRKIEKKIDLPKSAQEGIAFDTKGFFYIANDEGSILKYSQELLDKEKK